MPVTQKDIARAAGVSQTIVSDVLQGRPRGRVSEETRARILAAARELAYRPNALARALRSRKSRQVVYMTTHADVDRFNALGEQIIGGLARGLSERDYRLFIEVVATPDREVPTLREMIASGICDACVVRAIEDQDDVWPDLREIEQPVVVVGQCPDPLLTSIAHDAPGMVRTALAHLVRRGHRRVALVGDPPHTGYHRRIWRAWRAEAEQHGLDPDRWVQEDGGREAIAATVERWLAAPDGPTALLCLDAVAPIGASDAILRSGRRPGDDLDMVVIAPSINAWLYPPGSWYFGTDHAVIGRRAAEELAALLDDRPPTGPVRILPPLLQR